ncbi:MAG: cbb3-type cytochrome c oxidase subunit 3 [Aestuariivirga sp.]
MQFEYTLLREFADSWALMMMFVFFIGVVAWAMRPGAAEIQKDAASIPFKED